ncbi:MAG: hypothetical protein RIS47_1796 [Bacteroidota bacterium]
MKKIALIVILIAVLQSVYSQQLPDIYVYEAFQKTMQTLIIPGYEFDQASRVDQGTPGENYRAEFSNDDNKTCVISVHKLAFFDEYENAEDAQNVTPYNFQDKPAVYLPTSNGKITRYYYKLPDKKITIALLIYGNANQQTMEQIVASIKL